VNTAMRDDFDIVSAASSTCNTRESAPFSGGRSVSPFNDITMGDDAPSALAQSENASFPETKESGPVGSRPKRGRRQVEPFVSNTAVLGASNVRRGPRPKEKASHRQGNITKGTTKRRVGRPRKVEKSTSTQSSNSNGKNQNTTVSALGCSSVPHGKVVVKSDKRLEGDDAPPSAPKRKRGRPRKIKEPDSSSNGRRSPRKSAPIERLGMADAADYYLEDEEVMPKRKRGRPPKNRNPDPASRTLPVQPPRKRGRPPKNRRLEAPVVDAKPSMHKDSLVLSDSRRSGRQRQRTDRLGMADDADYDLEPEEEVFVQEKPKRKRGRPPKNPTPNAPLQPKRKRGRPRKNPAPATLVAATIAAGVPPVTIGPNGNLGMSDAPRKRGRPPKNRDASPVVAASTAASTSSVARLCEAPQKKHWKDLKHEGLVSDYVYGKFVPLTFGNSLESAIATVQDGLDEVQGSAEALPDSDPCVIEAKMYQRSMKERQQRSDGERIEKLRHREEYENRLREFQYKIRGRKRSPYEAELDEICTKPLEFTEATRESARTMKCRFGPDCKLCCPGSPTHSTNEEEKKASTRIPSVRLCRIADSWVETRLEDEAVEFTKKQPRRRRRQARDAGKIQNTIDILTEMKHSLDFTKRYNEGYL